MKYLILTCILSIYSLVVSPFIGSLHAQDSDTTAVKDSTVIMDLGRPDAVPGGTKLTINATGEILVPADLVILQINITVTGLSPEAVFENHKARENTLVELIREQNIDTDNLRFQPMNISSYTTRDGMNGNSVREFRSNQTVSLTLDDFDLFEEVQVFLIENGFDNFNGQFSSTRADEVQSDALLLALENAHESARTIAESFGLQVRSVVSVEHGTLPITRQANNETAMLQVADSASMMEFGQQVRVRSTVTVEFLAS